MPTYQRRYFIIKAHNDHQEQEEANENQNSSTKTGKHTKTIKTSGGGMRSQLDDINHS